MRRAVFAASLMLALPFSHAEEPIHLTYSERPPYMMQNADGTVGGLTGAPAAAAFKAAHIPVQWHKVPTNRQLLMVKDHSQLSCAIGWFDTPARQQYAKFTKPIYRDRTWVALTNTAFAARNVSSLEDLGRHSDARVLIKENYSYGGLDAFMQQWRPVTAISTATTIKMVQSVSTGMVDLMFVSEDEGHYIIKEMSARMPSLRLLQFKDMPRGMDRHIMCGKNVPDEVIARLNKAITFK